MPSWTKDQSLAINERGGKLIVSAAAGSGKTAVLSERVIKYVLDGGSISDLLIVTFTKAAAEEMRGRIKDKIINELAKNPKNEHLQSQVYLVQTAKITTMDAFYSDVVKENFEKLGIDRNFQILSNEEERIIKEEVLTKVLEDAFDNVSNYELMLSGLGATDTSLVKDAVFKVANFLQTLPFKEEFIKTAIRNYDETSSLYKDKLLKQIRDKMRLYDALYSEIITELYDASDEFDKLLDGVNKEKKFINDFLTINDFDDLSSRLRSISFDTLRTPRGHKDDPVLVKYKFIRDDFKTEVKKNMAELSFINNDVYNEEQGVCKRVVVSLLELVNTYLEKLLEVKKEKNAFSFSDVAYFVIDLLIKDGKKTPLAKSMSKQFKEILIDEYQDTNNLQNVIFSAISDDDKNLFIVGDVKQSIYRFRSACPEIFNKDKKEASVNSFPKLISLSKNFRSRAGVLDFCNFIFENTMTNHFGEVIYDDQEKLYLGASYEPGENLETEVHLLDGKTSEILDDEDDLSKVQKEAIYVAARIKSLIKNKHQVFDNKLGVWRNIKESDVVILLRSLKNSEYYVKALNKRGVSVYSQSASTYFDNYDVKLVINLLKVVDNPDDDVALMSVLNSPLVNVSLDDVIGVRTRNGSVRDNVMNGDNDDLKGIIKTFEDLRSYSHNNGVYELLVRIYNELDVKPIIGAMKGGKQRQKNLVQMLNHAVNYEKNGVKSVHEFISYIEAVTLNKDSLEGINPLSEGDNVLITTIHKSKGLEYPVVFVCETGKSFNFADVRSDLMINDDLGICFPVRNQDYRVRYESVPMMLFKDYEKNKMLSEELRVLYVALTRAKEKLIITGFTPNLSSLVSKAAAKMGNGNTVSNLYLKSCKSYLDIMIPCLLRHPLLKDLRCLSSVDVKTFLTPSEVKLSIVQASSINDSEFNELNNSIKQDFDVSVLNKISGFHYDVSLCQVPVNLSVSMMKQKNQYFKRPNFMLDGVDHAKIGTLYHRVLEVLPIKKYGVKELENALDSMILSGNITKEERGQIKLDKIFSFLTSDVYDIMLNAEEVMREHEIRFEIPANYYDETLKSGKILTEGVIDLLFIKDGVYYLIDYKTDNLNDEGEFINRYGLQLQLYEYGIKQLMNAKVIKKFIYSIRLDKFIEL